MKKILMSLPVVATLLAGCNSSTQYSSSPSPLPTSSAATQASPVTDTTPSPVAGVEVGGAMMLPTKNLVENASAATNFKTLLSLVKSVGLDTTLSGIGPFTVFAPTDDAFAKLPKTTLDSLQKKANKAKLMKILAYHAVPGRYLLSDLQDGQTLKTVDGEMLTVHKNGTTVTINNAVIQTGDVVSSNGITHVIDTVLMPTGK